MGPYGLPPSGSVRAVDRELVRSRAPPRRIPARSGTTAVTRRHNEHTYRNPGCPNPPGLPAGPGSSGFIIPFSTPRYNPFTALLSTAKFNTPKNIADLPRKGIWCAPDIMKVETNMNATAPAAEPVTLDPVYVLRDEIAQSYSPANGFERMLVLAAAQAWLRYQAALNLERRVYEKTDPLELFSQSIDKFKTVLRYVAECERAWRRSLAELRSTIRARGRQTLASPNARRGTPRASALGPDLQNEPNPAPQAEASRRAVQNEPNPASQAACPQPAPRPAPIHSHLQEEPDPVRHGLGLAPEANPEQLQNEPNRNLSSPGCLGPRQG